MLGQVAMSRRPHSEGEEFNLHNLEQWCMISPLRGDVLFVDLQSTDFHVEAETWAPFLVLEVALLKALGTLSIEVKFLGGCSSEINKEMSARFNRRTGRIHLCGTTPCLEEEAGSLHVTRFVWHTLHGAEGWLTTRAVRTATNWLQGANDTDEGAGLDESGQVVEVLDEEGQKDSGKERAGVRRSALRQPRKSHKSTTEETEAKSKEVKEGEKTLQPFKKSAARPSAPKSGSAPSASKPTGKGVGSGPGTKAALDPAKVQRLREELKKSRQKLAAGGGPDPSPDGEGDGSGESSGTASTGSTNSEDSSSAAERKGLTAGTLMGAKTSRTTTKAIKDGTTGDYHEQLIQRAAGTAELSRKEGVLQDRKRRSRSSSKRKADKKDKDRKEDKEKKRKKDRKSDKKKKKKSKKEKKKKKKRRKVTLSDGRTISCSSDSRSDSEGSPSTDEGAELEAP